MHITRARFRNVLLVLKKDDGSSSDKKALLAAPEAVEAVQKERKELE